jgi:hypothetical protein
MRLKTAPFRSRAYLMHVASHGCLICRQPAQAHHLLRAPGKGMGVKSGDNWSISLCPEHHTALHLHGDETAYLAQYDIDGPAWAAQHFMKWKNGR